MLKCCQEAFVVIDIPKLICHWEMGCVCGCVWGVNCVNIHSSCLQHNFQLIWKTKYKLDVVRLKSYTSVWPNTAHLSICILFIFPKSLNWTQKPFEGDIQLTWRYEFLGSDTPPGMTSRLLAYCRNHCPRQAVYQHYWTNGLLMKMGQVWHFGIIIVIWL